MMVFYKMNPKLIERYQPYMNEWVNERISDSSMTGWVNGLYMTRVVGVALGGNEGYPETPIDLIRGEQLALDDEEAYEFTDADRFGAWAMMFNRQFEADRLPEEKQSEAKDTTDSQPTIDHDSGF